jgi:hypothetical protein
MSGGARVSDAVAAGFGLLARARGDRALHPRAAGPGRFALGAARPGGRDVVALAEAHVTRRLDPPPPESASFDPIMHAAPDFRQAAGRLDALRAAAYRASRSGRAR